MTAIRGPLDHNLWAPLLDGQAHRCSCQGKDVAATGEESHDTLAEVARESSVSFVPDDASNQVLTSFPLALLYKHAPH